MELLVQENVTSELCMVIQFLTGQGKMAAEIHRICVNIERIVLMFRMCEDGKEILKTTVILYR